MNIQENVALAPLTTLKVGGPARYFAQSSTAAEVAEAVQFARARGLPLFVLGGGSNLLVSDTGWAGLVLKIAISGIDERKENGKTLFEVGAGEEWDRFVARSVTQNCAGVECLSGIPGSVGGTPVQNVGAYGQEVAETIVSVLSLRVSVPHQHLQRQRTRTLHYSAGDLCPDSRWSASNPVRRPEKAFCRLPADSLFDQHTGGGAPHPRQQSHADHTRRRGLPQRRFVL
jgi:UDP-N-acetylenolpyruvoylglucosamine reductase